MSAVRVSTMIDPQDDDLVIVLVDSVHDPECASPGDPGAVQLALEGLADAVRRLKHVAGAQRNDRGGDPFGQRGCDRSRCGAGDDQFVGR